MAGLVIVCDGTGLTKSKLAAASPEVQRQVMLEGFQTMERMRAALDAYGRRMGWTKPTPAPIASPRREARPREQRPSARRRVTRGSPSSDPSEPEPPDTDLNRVWREARDRFETAEEYRTLARLAVIRARGMRRWAA
jgi:hypothetical protein